MFRRDNLSPTPLLKERGFRSLYPLPLQGRGSAKPGGEVFRKVAPLLLLLFTALPAMAQNPVLKARCLSCHSGEKPAGNLNLSTPDSLRQNAARILRVIDSGQMPPSGKLPAAELTQLKMAIPAPNSLWSLKPLPGVALGKAFSIDAPVRAALAQKGLVPSPQADKRTLLRRVTVDLTGLPPPPQEIADVLADMSPDA